HWFWTEQYLVHALLIDNSRIEVLLANHALERSQHDVLRRLFPQALRWTGGSLWLRMR
ncbi:MAG: class I SAM-dependent methyltransferase, partial [Armatimonadetes bacterium]|nr:class I SAM-dependent methyltransferase [Anaerolineae bacterium]